ncbi:MAG: ATP synthase subunit I [Actinomycetota bacterium]|nr:ATP synthase subunit I [Actinomycetota bacterium]
MNSAPLFAPAPGSPAVERQLVSDMVRRVLPVTPVILLVAGLVGGTDGALTVGFGLALVVVNFALSAALLSWAGRHSIALLMGTALFGYLLRMGLVALAIYAVKDQSWAQLGPLAVTILVTHLGLLWWETRHLSLTLAFPGVKPRQGD